MLCPACGFTNEATVTACRTCGVLLVDTTTASQVLPAGSTLDNNTFTVSRVLGQGGFGITYLGSDTRLRRPVAIKVFFPAGCVRQNATVQPTGAWTSVTYSEARTVSGRGTAGGAF